MNQQKNLRSRNFEFLTHGSITIKWSNFIPSMLSISTDSSNLVMNIDHDVLNRLGLNGDFAEKNMKIGPELAKWG